MTEVIWLSLKPKSPLHIGLPKPNYNFLPTNTIIPGSVIRGALAELLLAQGEKNKIREVIDDMYFGFFFPTTVLDRASLPLPITAFSCKSHFGFKSSSGHGIFDTLLTAVVYKELEKNGAKFPVPFSFKCPNCFDRVDFASGFYYERNGFNLIEVKKHSQTKVAINRLTRTAESGMLYSVTAIDPGEIRFIGKIKGEEKNIKLVEEALQEMGIGAFTTRGYGQVEVARINIKMEKLQDRIQVFNQKMNEVWDDLLTIAGVKKSFMSTYFSIDFISPGILNEQGIPTLKLSLEIQKERLEPIYWASVPVFISGWSTAWGLPKETELGIAIGSTYVFKVEAHVKKYLPELQRLEKEGIGERRDEGYGEILICHPFHKEVCPV
jgi:CRISPR-associated protein Csx10